MEDLLKKRTDIIIKLNRASQKLADKGNGFIDKMYLEIGSSIVFTRYLLINSGSSLVVNHKHLASCISRKFRSFLDLLSVFLSSSRAF